MFLSCRNNYLPLKNSVVFSLNCIDDFSLRRPVYIFSAVIEVCEENGGGPFW